MATVRSLVSDAYLEIGVIATGEVPDAALGQLGLLRFQHQLDAWQAESLTLYNFVRTTYTLLSGTSSVTIGPSGTITTAANPVFLNNINYVVPSTSPAVEVPMGRMDDDSYMNLSIKGLSSNLPQTWFFNPGSTNGTLTFWPVVSQNVDLAIYAYFGVGIPATLDDVIVGPPGYAEAFMYQLALRLCNPTGRPIPPALPQFATDAFARIKRVNVEPGLLGTDQALIPAVPGAYNVLSDSTSAPSSR